MESSLIKSVGFVHCHVHSAYSLREGALTIETLAKYAKADEQPALAITDTNNLFGALEFSEKLAKSGIQPLIGLQLTVDFGDAPKGASSRISEQKFRRSPLALIAKNERGYMNLMRLASDVWLKPGDGEEPHVPFDLFGDCEGLIALTGGAAGPLDQALAAGFPEIALTRLRRLEDAFGDRLYVELQRHGLEGGKSIEDGLVTLAYEEGLPLVATNEPYFAGAKDFEAQDALLCIAEGALLATPERRRLSPEHRFKTRKEMLALFTDLPEATDNSVEIALRCSYRPLTRKPILPRFSVPGGQVVDEDMTQSIAGVGELEGLNNLGLRHDHSSGAVPAGAQQRCWPPSRAMS